jgi:uncharacterized membrane protein
MPAFKKLLSDEERWQVVSYLHTFGAGAKSAKPPENQAAPAAARQATERTSTTAMEAKPSNAADNSSGPASRPATTAPAAVTPDRGETPRAGDEPGGPQRRHAGAAAAARSGSENHWRHFVRWAGHFHPPLTAFPIALLLGAALAEALRVLGGGAAWLEEGSRWCVILGTLGAVAAALLGWAFAMEHEDSWILEVHRWMGTVAAVGSVGILVLSEVAHRRRRTWLALFRIVLFLAVPLVAATGFFGGAMIYGLNAYRW